MPEYGYEEIGEDEVNDIREAMEAGGLAGAAERIQVYLESLDSVELNIAITGESGAGKSTFVNAFRGLKEEDEGAAPTGVVETTAEPTEYPHPKFPNVTIWDLPGIGTPNFKADEYLEQVNFKRYDFFIIIASERFRSNNVTLAMQIQEMKKKFYFVRSKIDENLRAESRKRGYSEEKTLDQIRQNCVQGLEDHGVKDPRVFLISSFDLKLYDFDRLEETLEKELPKHKRHILLLSLPNISLQVSKRKQEELRARIWKLAALSCGVAVVPIPGLSVVCDVAILVRELTLYYNTFSLDDESLQSLAQRVDKPVEDLKSVIKSPLAKEISSDVVLKLLMKAAGGGLMVVEYWVSTIPIFGSIAAGGISFGTTYYMLKSCLEELAEDSCNVLKKAFETEV
ncbi:interferon-inducible GTPase 5-like [Acipenser ruthenus]|uniref:interferon-inducible GTPase 5-like n=1 Tax=Acipenser ruthenus TaxID=7906 RepID=UPI0027420DA7|nr:interferon-inducible GTPase 5-like [Acipenser ruthenus]XP_034773017.2 interferon-inducible GTPase 5-like [Acipenser ruthenus]XP_058876060.1 interferon-inducible GTPase 5-like [Acipenser ruthenus]XP_058876061.1 interferon-inducible GTPase 5-like [Acipenser ruthenus]